MTNCSTNFRFILGIEVYETSRSTRRYFDRRARALGFTQAQWRALFRLDANPGITQAGLADLLDMQPISLARILDRMVAGGLIERRPDPNDRRAVKLFLTPAASPILKVLHEIANELRVAATKGIPPEEQERIIAGLRLIRSNIESIADEDLPAKQASNV